MRIRDLMLLHLHIAELRMEAGEVWCVLGENGAGKSLLGAALAGELPEADAAIEDRPARVRWTSFESQQALYEGDLANDDSNFVGGGDHGATALQVVMQSGCGEAAARTLASRLGAAQLLDRMYRRLSTGEARRVVVLQAVASGPDLLVLDEPFEGLDPAARLDLLHVFAQLLQGGHALMLLVNRRDDIADFTTHLAVLHGGELVLQGPRDSVLRSAAFHALTHRAAARSTSLPAPPPGDVPHFEPLVRMRACSVHYGDVTQLAPFDWTLHAGEHTLIVGENGSGKSTLLQLISGDHPQCYTNDLQVFGYQRGSGESIWEIKRHIGLISPALHRDYRVNPSLVETIVSGLHDSIGLYQAMQPSERKLAHDWLELLELTHDAERPLHSLSYGQQRLVLIARALIKQPPLVILDEPTQGLDDENRQLVLAFFERLSGLPRTTLLFVSHRHDEHLPLFRSRLELLPSTQAGTRYELRVA